jgi:hypothetical protein
LGITTNADIQRSNSFDFFGYINTGIRDPTFTLTHKGMNAGFAIIGDSYGGFFGKFKQIGQEKNTKD